MDIALLGKAGAGKDAAAAHLVRSHGYTRIAFADPLKEMALSIDPYVEAYTSFCDEYSHETTELRLSALVAAQGWDSAKRLPEVRRLLQQMGHTVRAYDQHFWLNVGLKKWIATRGATVFTDVRYPNEVLALATRGFVVVRIVRPGFDALTGDAAGHDSETALDGFREDVVTIVNDGSLAELAAKMDTLARDMV